jgi:uncharacterized protein with HEPN domain
MRSDRDRILDMLEAISKIEQYVNRESGFSRFEEDELLQVWIIHHLSIIGEAAARLSDDFREQHPDISWGGMIGMRHVLVHGYFETDNEIIWKVIEQDLPTLKNQLQKLI